MNGVTKRRRTHGPRRSSDGIAPLPAAVLEEVVEVARDRGGPNRRGKRRGSHADLRGPHERPGPRNIYDSKLAPASPSSPPTASGSTSQQYDVEVKVEDVMVNPVAEIGPPLSECSGPSPAMYDRRNKRVSLRQLEILCDFFISNRCIATAHNRSLQDKEYSRRKWTDIAEILNSQADGAHKDWAGWTKYWVDYKAKLKKRVAVLRASPVWAWGGPYTERPFSEIEEKFLQVLGEDIGPGLPGVQVELPPEIGFATTDVNEQKCPPFESILQNGHFLPYPTVLTPTQNLRFEPMPQNPPLEPMVQDPPAPSPRRTPTPHPPTASAAHSLRHRRRRREPPMSQETARRTLVRSSQIRAEAAVKISNAMEKMVHQTAALVNVAARIERILNAASPKAAEQRNHE